MNIYQFMSNHVVLTFFMCYMFTETICVAFRALGGKYKNRTDKGE